MVEIMQIMSGSQSTLKHRAWLSTHNVYPPVFYSLFSIVACE